ncbi:zinc finger protein 180-like isoform X2 [Pteropus medius]|uniref:zinc finger protein 180-like isoform X2 n=1 Tax=Pteropus vampyrus TaxID=132908 RepID=UPI00196BA0C7|nr:zinc finger protein 180-like isoform X2 [Pteropus giganteus]
MVGSWVGLRHSLHLVKESDLEPSIPEPSCWPEEELRTSGACLCLEERMEEREEKPPGPLKACTQSSLLPQEIIIKVEREDAGSLAVPSQEGANFKIVTVDFTREEEHTLKHVQRTLDRGVILENHKDLVSWGCLIFLFSRLSNCI